MAATSIPLPLSAPQPGLRSFIVYNRIPKGCIAVQVIDGRAEPHFHCGEFAIVDPRDREPVHGDMSVIGWNNGRLQVVETRSLSFQTPGRGGQSVEATGWLATWLVTMVNLDGSEARTCQYADGPYEEDEFRRKLVGRVVGIYGPSAIDRMESAD